MEGSESRNGKLDRERWEEAPPTKGSMDIALKAQEEVRFWPLADIASCIAHVRF